MDDKSVEQLTESTRECFKSSSDTACRNLAELVLLSLELRDLARDVHDADFWERDKENEIKVDEMKNLRLNDILFFKDASFKKRTLQFFEKVGAACEPDNYIDRQAIEHFLEYLLFFTNCKLREFRNVSTQFAAAFFTGMLKTLGSVVTDHKKDSKPKIRLSVSLTINLISRFYYEQFLKLRTDDVDSHIVAAVLEHLMSSYSEGLALAVDEATFLATVKHADRAISELAIVKDGSFSTLCLALILKGLRSSSGDRVAKFLPAVPKIINDIETSESALSKWDARSKSIAENSVKRLQAELPVILKAMVEHKDEVGSAILRFFIRSKNNERCKALISPADERIIFFMINSAKPKTRDSALDYIELVVKGVAEGQESFAQRAKLNKLAEILYQVQKYKDEDLPGNFGGKYAFDEKRALDLLFPFIPSLNTWFDASIVASVFLEDSNEEIEETAAQDRRAYIGCILLTILQTIRLIEDDKMPSSKLTDELRGEALENIKASCISARTLIKESVRRNLALRYSSDPASFRVHLKLIMVCYPDYDQHLQNILLDVFGRASDQQLLREVAFCIRQIATQQDRHSAIAGGIFVEEVQKLFEDQIQILGSLVNKWKAALQNEEPHLVKIVLQRLEEDMIIPLTKLSTLKMSLPYGLRLTQDGIESVVFLLDITITDNLHNKNIVQQCLRLVHEHLKYLMKNMLTNKALQEDFIKWRDTCLEYFVFFMDRRSNPRMPSADALEVRRLAFPLLAENLQVISHDRLVSFSSSYRRPDEQIFKIIWQFIEDYLFTSDPSKVQDPSEVMQQSNEENKDFGTLDVERSPIQNSGAKEANKIEAGAVYLRCKGFRFIEDAATIVAVAFKLCLHLFRTIGLNLAQCLVLKVLNLESVHQGVFLSKADEFFGALIHQEQESGNTQRLVFWKFVHSCFAVYDFQTLKKLSKAVFRFYARHHGSDEAKRRYENFCIHTVQWATEQKDPESSERVVPFIKKSLFEEQRFVRLLFFAQNLVDSLKEEFRDREEELLKSDKYKVTTRLRDELAKMCHMQPKDEDKAPSRRQSKSAQRGNASKRKSRAPAKMDEEKENVDPVLEPPVAKKTGPSKLKGVKGKNTKGTIVVDEVKEDSQSKAKSSVSNKEASGRKDSRSVSRQSNRSESENKSSAQSSKKTTKNPKRDKSKQGKKKGKAQKQKRKPSPDLEQQPEAKKEKSKRK